MAVAEIEEVEFGRPFGSSQVAVCNSRYSSHRNVALGHVLVPGDGLAGVEQDNFLGKLGIDRNRDFSLGFSSDPLVGVGPVWRGCELDSSFGLLICVRGPLLE